MDENLAGIREIREALDIAQQLKDARLDPGADLVPLQAKLKEAEGKIPKQYMESYLQIALDILKA